MKLVLDGSSGVSTYQTKCDRVYWYMGAGCRQDCSFASVWRVALLVAMSCRPDRCRKNGWRQAE